MGYLTTVTIHNDALHAFRENPEAFGKAILEGIDSASMNNREESVGFKGYCNYISVQAPRHADDQTVYVHSGNTVFNLNPYNKEFKELAERNPDVLKSFINTAQFFVTSAKKKLKQTKKENE
jgi:hypothetical protein